jgi:dihydropteroate synthase
MSLSAQQAPTLSPLERLKRLFGTSTQARSAPIPIRHVKASLVGKGFVDPRQRKGVRRIVVTVEENTFDLVRDHAVANGIPVAEAVRRLIGTGLSAAAK